LENNKEKRFTKFASLG